MDEWMYGMDGGALVLRPGPRGTFSLKKLFIFKGLRPLPPAPLLTGIRLFGREVKQVDLDKDSIL